MKTAQLILKNGDSINRPIVEVELIEKPLWWQLRGLSYTASGYGRKIPTSYVVRYNGRWFRYCCIFSNSGTNYITVKGVDIITEIN